MSHSSVDPDQAVLERAQRFCLTCPRMCRFACPVAHVEARETVTPWGLMGLLRMVEQGAVPLDAEVAETLTHCSGCRRCQGACVHQNPVVEAVFEGRRRAAHAGQAPFDRPPRDPEPLSLDGTAAGFAPNAEVGFWLAADEGIDPFQRARRVAMVLSAFGGGVQWAAAPGVASTSGYEWLAAGHPSKTAAHAKALCEAWRGFSVLLTDSAGLLTMLASPRWQRPWVEAGLPARVLHWTEYLAEKLAQPDAPPPLRGSALGPVVYQDPCKLARSDAPIIDPPRALLRWAFGEESLRELPDHGANALCCGQGAGYSDHHPDTATELAAGLLRDAARLGVKRVVSGAPSCAGHLAALGAEGALKVQSLEEALADVLLSQVV